MDLIDKLQEPLPDEAVKPHPTKTYLSSIKAIYVTERFNNVFGVGKWTIRVNTESVDTNTGMVVVKVAFEVPELNIYYESFGGNDNGGANSKNFDLGDAYKGASTDAITKIGSYLGVGINVFKGLHDNTNERPNGNSNNDLTPDGKAKNWIAIGDALWQRALEKQMPLKELRDYCKVSKANGQEYEKQLNSK